MTDQRIEDGVHFVVARTALCERELLARVRPMLDVVFDGDFSDDDWEHTLGGIHVVACHGGVVVGHASLIQRRLIIGERALRAGYVEGVGVIPEWQRRGIGGAMMGTLERFIKAAYDIGALGATDSSVRMYTKRGWVQWQGPLHAMTPKGICPTPDEQGSVYIYTTEPIDVHASLTCDWRGGDVW